MVKKIIKQRILITTTIILVAILFISLTNSFFSANNPRGSTAEIISESGKMLINYDDEIDSIVLSSNIIPSNDILVNKTFTLTGINTTVGNDSATGLAMPYRVGVLYTSSFSDGMIHYYIKSTDKGTGITEVYTGEANQTVPGNDTYTGYSHGTFENGRNNYIEMVTGEFPASLDNQIITFNLIIQFPDNNVNQGSEQGKSFSGKVVVNYEPETISQTIAKLNYAENGLEVDNTSDRNIRYVGTNPKNYIIFNGEYWRIIGVFSVYNVDTGQNEKLVKIIRNEALGNYSWDSSASSINSGRGVNEWSQADLMTELNIDYLDISKTSGTTTWYNGSSNARNGQYDYSKNIKSSWVDKIANVRWNLGGYNTYSVSALNMYNAERRTAHISNPSDGVTRTNTWDGKIGLMYSSDYGYASTDSACRSSLGSANCKNNNWLFNSSYNQWILSPYSRNAYYVFYAGSGGSVGYDGAHYNRAVHPALFLKFDVVIAGGTGDASEPYFIEGDTINQFSIDSWGTIVNNIRNGNSSLYNVGDTKKIQINKNSYTVRLANNSSPFKCTGDYFSETACGFVIEFVDIVEKRKMNSTNTNVGGWESSEMRTYLNGDFYDNLPTDLKSVITDTKVISGHGSTSGESNFTTTDKIYLLSAHEVWANGTSNQVSSYDTAYNNTRQLDYYQSKGVTTNSYSAAIKKYNGSNDYWWLRAANSSNTSNFLYVYSYGSCYNNYASYSNGVSPAFRIG